MISKGKNAICRKEKKSDLSQRKNASSGHLYVNIIAYVYRLIYKINNNIIINGKIGINLIIKIGIHLIIIPWT